MLPAAKRARLSKRPGLLIVFIVTPLPIERQTNRDAGGILRSQPRANNAISATMPKLQLEMNCLNLELELGCNVRSGSIARVSRCPRYVRFSSDSDQIADVPTRRIKCAPAARETACEPHQVHPCARTAVTDIAHQSTCGSYGPKRTLVDQAGSRTASSRGFTGIIAISNGSSFGA